MNDNPKKGGRGGAWAVALMLVLAAVAGVNLWLWLTAPDKPTAAHDPVPVSLARAVSREVAVVLEQSAEVQAAADVLVVPKVKGRQIMKILVERGQAVKEGQLLAELDTEATLAKRQELLAGVAAATAKLAVLDKDLKRLRHLAGSGSAPAQRLDHVAAEQRAAVAELRLMQARLKSLDIVLGYHQITAPIAGLVAGRYFDVGALSDDKKPMFRISRVAQVKVLTTVGERDFPLLKKGLPVQVRVDAFPGRVFPGRVSVVSPVLNPATRSAEVEVLIDNPDRALSPGMFARVRLELGQRKALLVPRVAVHRLVGTGAHYVFVAQGQQAVHRNVRAGRVFGRMREITEGLEPGQEVVVRGAGRLSDGAAIVRGRLPEGD